MTLQRSVVLAAVALAAGLGSLAGSLTSSGLMGAGTPVPVAPTGGAGQQLPLRAAS